jgi:C1A family cysteine protease
MQINYILLFAQFIQSFNKQYSDFELQTRFFIFKDNAMKIFNHNSLNLTFKLDINEFADYNEEDMKKLRNYNVSLTSKKTHYCDDYERRGNTIFESIDWSHTFSTPIKNQNQCGSCWAFATVESVESALAINGYPLTQLSPQELVDCTFSYGNYGCNGGFMDKALAFIIENGICTDDEYPYMTNEGSCKPCSSILSISGCQYLPPNDQNILKEVVSIQPVIVAIEADSSNFQFYSSGIIDTVFCGTDLNHAVVIVGYGEEYGTKYWLVRNSWGEQWGENGYVRILRTDSSDDPGICGIAMYPMIPIVNKATN